MFGYVWIYSTMEKWEVEMMFEKQSPGRKKTKHAKEMKHRKKICI